MYKKGSVVYRQVRTIYCPCMQPSFLIPVQYQLEEPKPKPGSGYEDESMPISEKQPSKSQQDKLRKLRRKAQAVVEHVDIIKDDFWERRPWILSNKPGKLPEEADV